jgi:hypothetical protein
MSSPAPLMEGSALGDEGWSVAALPGRRKDRAEQEWALDHLPDGRRSGCLRLYLQGPEMDRQKSCLAVGEWRPAAADNQSSENRNSAL